MRSGSRAWLGGMRAWLFLHILPCVLATKMTQNASLGIVGGHEVFPPFKYSWMVGLTTDSQLIFCGGTLIAPTLVLTAAHCDPNLIPPPTHQNHSGSPISHRPRPPISVDVQLHRHDTRRTPAEEKVVTRTVLHWLHHPKYTWPEYDYDVAILVLDEPVDTDTLPSALLDIGPQSVLPPLELGRRHVESVKLVGPPIELTTMGWGVLAENTWPPSPTLQQVTIPLQDQRECARRYEGIRDVTQRMLCAGLEAGGRDACQMDSGGPLLMMADTPPASSSAPSSSASSSSASSSSSSASASSRLVGIVSWGRGCAQPGLFGVYTRVHNVRDFILEHMASQA